MATKKFPGLFLILLLSSFTQGYAVRSSGIQNSPTQIAVQLEDTISVQLVNCPAWGYCNEAPKLLFQLQEKVENKNFYKIHVVIRDTEEICKENSCILEMPVTEEDGLRVEYYARTSMGDETSHQEFTMRNIVTEDVPGQYLFELLGPAWQNEAAPCAFAWMLFPEVETEQARWMERIDSADQLYTSKGYALLAGKLIWHGIVDASHCEDGGLLANGAASPCGESAASPEVTIWQNQYNALIMQAGQEVNIPARLLKGLIAQESQFWPDWPELSETGYGMLSHMGIDMLLTWNTAFYLDICTRHYGELDCSSGYSALTSTQREFLQNDCLLRRGTDEEFGLIAETLYAGCNQTAQIVRNVTKSEPNQVTTYEDLWRMTLGVYHGGSDCIGSALQDMVDGLGPEKDKDLRFGWEDIVKYLSEGCESTADYFDKAAGYGV